MERTLDWESDHATIIGVCDYSTSRPDWNRAVHLAKVSVNMESACEGAQRGAIHVREHSVVGERIDRRGDFERNGPR